MAKADFSSDARVIPAIAPVVAAADAAVTPLAIDTKGFRWAEFHFNLGTIQDGASVKITGSDTSGGTYTDIVSAAEITKGATAATFAMGASDSNSTVRGKVHLDQFPRYLRLEGTVGSGGTSAIAASVVLTGCSNTNEYLDKSAGGLDELAFTVLSPKF